jgi:hypothetical protein
MRDKPVGGKKKPVARRSADASEGAANAAAKRAKAAEFAKFGEYLRASDVGGKGRSAAAGRRQAGLKKAVTSITASKMAGYASSTPSASPTSRKKASNAAQATEAKRAAAARRRAAARRTIPNTK